MYTEPVRRAFKGTDGTDRQERERGSTSRSRSGFCSPASIHGGLQCFCRVKLCGPCYMISNDKSIKLKAMSFLCLYGHFNKLSINALARHLELETNDNPAMNVSNKHTSCQKLTPPADKWVITQTMEHLWNEWKACNEKYIKSTYKTWMWLTTQSSY